MNKKRLIIIILCAVLLAGVGLTIALINNKLKTPNIDPNEVENANTPTAVPTDSPTAEPTPIPTVENRLENSGGMVLASEKLSFGLASNGRLSYVGSNSGQAYCYDWSNIVKLAGNSQFTAGLAENGMISFSGSDALSEMVSGWDDIVDITASDDVLFALTSSGRVYSTDNSTEAECAVKLFAAGSDFLVCVHPDSSLSGIGNLPDISAVDGLDPVSIACGRDFIVVLAQDGTVHSTKAIVGLSELTDITRIFAHGDTFAAIDANGVLYTDCGFIEAENELYGFSCMENVEWFSSSSDHALVMLRDGSVEAFGDNTYLQCKTNTWQLLPYITDEGYVYGLTVGSNMPDGSTLSTGDEVTLPNGQEGIAIILGDIDMDGDIDIDDGALLKKFISGAASLTAVQKRAANVCYNSSDPLGVDQSDLVQLDYHISGYTQIDQYAKDFRYSAKLAEYRNINTDVTGYIKVDKTNIEGPLMYGDNFYYHTHNYAKTPTSRGSLYLYYDRPVQNIVITGHNLRVAGIMLHQLHLIQDKYAKDYDKFENRVWYINLFGETHLWEVFAMYEEKPANPKESSQYYNCNFPNTMEELSDAEIAEWIEYQQERSELNYQLHVTPQDRFITILTCADQHWESNQGGRIYFFLRMVDGH